LKFVKSDLSNITQPREGVKWLLNLLLILN